VRALAQLAVQARRAPRGGPPLGRGQLGAEARGAKPVAPGTDDGQSGPMPPGLRLRPLNDGDEAEALAAHAELAADDFSFLLDHDTARPWAEHVQRHRRIRCGVDLPADRVRGAFLLATTGDEVVGRVSVRFELNDWLATQGGHIGYGIRPGRRGQGYATEILRKALVVARSEGVGAALLTCDPDNEASAAVIFHNGGVEDEPHTDAAGTTKRRSWIA